MSTTGTCTTTQQALQQAVQAMRSGHHRFDVTIICTTDDYQAQYWMDLLENGILKGNKVLAVSEDWNAPGGAGNGLGTLYAYQKACALCQSKYDGMDLAAELAAGNISAALYHTAGKGTRLAPLPASENNNKPGVNLPFPLHLPDGSVRPLAVLEAVIRQTGLYANNRKGRLSVFWGDQVFLPSASSFDTTPTHHIDILCTLLGDQAPTAEEWKAQGLDKYGVIAVLEQDGATSSSNSSNGGRKVVEAAQVEKVSHETAVSMLSGLGGTLKQVGPSLGSFSVSADMLQALMEEFATELQAKDGKLDTDPHFWMPMTLSLDSYMQLMQQKGTDHETSKKHYERMHRMKQAFLDKISKTSSSSSSSLGLFGAVNVGKEACWWDYGQIKLYSQNSLLLLEKSPSADLLRQFLGCEEDHQVNSTVGAAANVDETSYIIASKVGAGSVNKSLVANVKTPQLDCDGAIVVNCVAKKIKAGKGAILYNLLDESREGIVAEAGQVKVGLSKTEPDGTVSFNHVLQSRMDIDGGKAWKQKLEMNEFSFEDIHKQNKDADIGSISAARKAAFESLAASMGL